MAAAVAVAIAGGAAFVTVVLPLIRNDEWPDFASARFETPEPTYDRLAFDGPLRPVEGVFTDRRPSIDVPEVIPPNVAPGWDGETVQLFDLETGLSRELGGAGP